MTNTKKNLYQACSEFHFFLRTFSRDLFWYEFGNGFDFGAVQHVGLSSRVWLINVPQTNTGYTCHSCPSFLIGERVINKSCRNIDTLTNIFTDTSEEPQSTHIDLQSRQHNWWVLLEVNLQSKPKCPICVLRLRHRHTQAHTWTWTNSV